MKNRLNNLIWNIITAIVVLLYIFLIMVIGVNAEKQGDKAYLIQTCNNCTYCNITKITNPFGSIILNNLIMTKDGSSFNYTLNSNYTTDIGNYCWYYDCGNPSESATGKICFDVSPSGNNGTNNIVFIIFIILIIYSVSFIGFFFKNEIVALLGGMFMIGLSIYLINNGIIVYRDWMTTYFAYLTLGIGAFFSIVSALSLFEDL